MSNAKRLSDLVDVREKFLSAIATERKSTSKSWIIVGDSMEPCRFTDSGSVGDTQNMLECSLPQPLMNRINTQRELIGVETAPLTELTLYRLTENNAKAICEAYGEPLQAIPLLDWLNRAEKALEAEIKGLRMAEGLLPATSAAEAVREAGLPSLLWCAAMLGENRSDKLIRWYKAQPDYFMVMLEGLVALKMKNEAKIIANAPKIISALGVYGHSQTECITSPEKIPEREEDKPRVRMYDYYRRDTGEYFRVTPAGEITYL